MFKEAALVGIKIPFFFLSKQLCNMFLLKASSNSKFTVQQNIVFIFTVLSSIFQGLYLKDFNTHTAGKKTNYN